MCLVILLPSITKLLTSYWEIQVGYVIFPNQKVWLAHKRKCFRKWAHLSKTVGIIHYNVTFEWNESPLKSKSIDQICMCTACDQLIATIILVRYLAKLYAMDENQLANTNEQIYHMYSKYDKSYKVAFEHM